MGLFHIHLVSLRRILLMIQAVTSFLMVGTVTDGRVSLAIVPSWDIKPTREAHVLAVVILGECLVVLYRCLPTLLCGTSLLCCPCWCWRLPYTYGHALSFPSLRLASLASFPSSLKFWRWSCGHKRWSWGYGCVCCHWWRG